MVKFIVKVTFNVISASSSSDSKGVKVNYVVKLALLHLSLNATFLLIILGLNSIIIISIHMSLKSIYMIKKSAVQSTIEKVSICISLLGLHNRTPKTGWFKQ